MYRTWDSLREAMPRDLPYAIREVILGNVVVGNLTDHLAVRLAQTIARKLEKPKLTPKEWR